MLSTGYIFDCLIKFVISQFESKLLPVWEVFRYRIYDPVCNTLINMP